MAFNIEPLTPELWPAFADLFGKQGACYGCWCTYFRLPPAARRASTRENNRDHIRRRIEAGPPPGLLWLDGGRADGWMQIGPRADVPQWNNARRASAPVTPGDADDAAAWAISCFYVRPGARGSGIMHHFVQAGIEHARRCGARMLEACPMDRSGDPRAMNLFVGSTRVFEKAGFQRMAERRAGRPLMRFVL